MNQDQDDRVLVVAAGTAWPFYRLTAAYVCQAGRSFQPTRWLAFYSARTLHGVAARIEGVIDDLLFSTATSARMAMSVNVHERRIGNVMAAALKGAWTDGRRYQLMLLSAEHDQETVRFHDLPHSAPAAYVMGQRYTRLALLRAATTTDDLIGVGRSDG